MKYIARYGKEWAKKSEPEKLLGRELQLPEGDKLTNYVMVSVQKQKNIKTPEPESSQYTRKRGKFDEQNISRNSENL